MSEGTRGSTAEGDRFESPLASRYASVEMRSLFSARSRIRTWRRLWIELARCQHELGLGVPLEAIDALAEHTEEIDFEAAAAMEKRLRHDVMAHLHTFAQLHPEAKPWLHLGATSCFVTDNADLILLREALRRIAASLVEVVRELAGFAERWRALPTLGYTHFQPAQPTTVGKRACLWIQDLLLDLEEVERLVDWLPLRGAKGTTGTQASFLELFEGDHARVRALDAAIAARFQFARTFAVTGQTYPRKVDSRILDTLSGIGQTAAKVGNDLRLLAHERELEEPYESEQVGSSAMAYKRNPMRAERMCSLARFLVHLPANTADTASQQWLERTLDDSANRRVVLAEGFLAADAILRIYHSIARGLIVNPAVVRAHLDREVPFLCTEDVLMRGVKAGGDRQDLHEQVRVHARAAIERMKAGALDNDLLDRLTKDPMFAAVAADLGSIAKAERLVGRAPEQVDEFLATAVRPVLERHPGGAALRELDV